MDMGEDLLQYCHKFFPEFDFLLMLFHYVLILFVIMMLLKATVPEDLVKTNLTFNIAMLTFLLMASNMAKNSFPNGFFNLTDETKMQLLFSFKSLLITWCCLNYTEGAAAQLLGFDFDKSHETFVRRLNEIFSLTGNQMQIYVEFTYWCLSFIAAFITFITMKNSVNFAFYFFVFSRTAQKTNVTNYLET